KIGKDRNNGSAGKRCFVSEAYVDARLSLVVYFYLPGATAWDFQHRSLLDGGKGISNPVAAVVFNVQAEKGGDFGNGAEGLVLVDVLKVRQSPNLNGTPNNAGSTRDGN